MSLLHMWAKTHLANTENSTKAAEALLVTVRNVPTVRDKLLDRFGLDNCLTIVSEVLSEEIAAEQDNADATLTECPPVPAATPNSNTASPDTFSAISNLRPQESAVPSNATTPNRMRATNICDSSASIASPIAPEPHKANTTNSRSAAVPSATLPSAHSAPQFAALPDIRCATNSQGSPAAAKTNPPARLHAGYTGHKTPKGTMPKNPGAGAPLRQVVRVIEKMVLLDEEIYTGRKMRDCTRLDLENSAKDASIKSIYYSRIAKQLPVGSELTVGACFKESDLESILKGAKISDGTFRNAWSEGACAQGD